MLLRRLPLIFVTLAVLAVARPAAAQSARPASW